MKHHLYYVLFAFALFSCSQNASKQSEENAKQGIKQELSDSLSLKIACLPTLDALPLWVAEDCGLFTREKVDVRLIPFKAHMDVDTALVGGSVEGALTDCFRAEFLEKKGLKLNRFAVTPLSWKLIANRQARIKALRQLGDKMMAMTRHSATDYLCDEVLRNVKTTADVFRVQINDVDLRLSMLINNEIDALWLPEPQATKALLIGHYQLADSKLIKDSLGVFVFAQKNIDNEFRQSQIESFAKAYDTACDTLNKRGIHAFSDLIMKHTGVHEKAAIDSLVNIHYYKHATH